MTRDGQTRIYELITERITRALEAGVVPWHKPWRASEGDGAPLSMSTGKAYRGVNVWLLGLTALEAGYDSRWWGTYKQITERGGQVRKGEESSIVVFWKTYPRTQVNEETGERETKTAFVLNYYRVFNAKQADGLPAKFLAQAEPEPGDFTEAADAEQVIKAYLAASPTLSIRYQGARAHYQSGLDLITLPPREVFDDTDSFYGTAFHEIGHSTGHKSRCDRPGVARFDHFGSERYGKEELVAEMTASILCALTGTDGHFSNSASYVGSWIKAIKGDHKLVVQAAAQAQHATDHILGLAPEGSES